METRNYDSGKKMSRKGALDSKVIVMRKDGIIDWSTLNFSVVVSLFFISILMFIPHFYPDDELPLMN